MFAPALYEQKRMLPLSPNQYLFHLIFYLQTFIMVQNVFGARCSVIAQYGSAQRVLFCRTKILFVYIYYLFIINKIIHVFMACAATGTQLLFFRVSVNLLSCYLND